MGVPVDDGGEVLEVLAPGQIAVEGGGLYKRPDPTEVGVGIGDRVAEHGRAATGGTNEPEQHRQGGRLPRAVGADQPRDHSARHLEVQLLHRYLLSVALAQALYADGRFVELHATMIKLSARFVVRRSVDLWPTTTLVVAVGRPTYSSPQSRRPGATSPAS